MNSCGAGLERHRTGEGKNTGASNSSRSSRTATANPHSKASLANDWEQCPAPTRQKSGGRGCGSIKTVTSPPQIAPKEFSLVSCKGYVFKTECPLEIAWTASEITSDSNFPPPIVPTL